MSSLLTTPMPMPLTIGRLFHFLAFWREHFCHRKLQADRSMYRSGPPGYHFHSGNPLREACDTANLPEQGILAGVPRRLFLEGRLCGALLCEMAGAADPVEMSPAPPRLPTPAPSVGSPDSMSSSSACMGTSATGFNEDEQRRAGAWESHASEGDEGEGRPDVVARGSDGERAADEEQCGGV